MKIKKLFTFPLTKGVVMTHDANFGFRPTLQLVLGLWSGFMIRVRVRVNEAWARASVRVRVRVKC